MFLSYCSCSGKSTNFVHQHFYDANQSKQPKKSASAAGARRTSAATTYWGAITAYLQGCCSGGSGGGGSGGFSGGSVICTALKNRGLLDKELHAKGSKYLETMHPCSVAGYQYWATSVAAKIDKGHKGWIKLCLPIARSRTSLLATDGTFIDHIKHPLGTITKFIGEPVCHVIGLVISDKAFFKFWNKQGA